MPNAKTKTRASTGKKTRGKKAAASVSSSDMPIEEVWLEFKKTASEELRNRLMENYLELVRYTAERMHMRLPGEVDVEDLMSAGLFGLMNIFARTTGGFISDMFVKKGGLKGRVKWLFIALFIEGIALLFFSQMRVLALAIPAMVVSETKKSNPIINAQRNPGNSRGNSSTPRCMASMSKISLRYWLKVVSKIAPEIPSIPTARRNSLSCGLDRRAHV